MLSEPGAGSFRIYFHPGWSGSNAAAKCFEHDFITATAVLGPPSGGLPLEVLSAKIEFLLAFPSANRKASALTAPFSGTLQWQNLPFPVVHFVGYSLSMRRKPITTTITRANIAF
jgi:hypothetical protein